MMAVCLLAASFFSSCKDNSPGSVDFSKSPALIAWQYAGFQATPYLAVMLPKDTYTENLEVALSVSSITLNSNVSATVTDVSSTYLKQYDKDNGLTGADSLEALPTSMYTSPTSVTIPAGQHIVKFPVVFKAGSIDFTKNYAIALKLTSASGAQIPTNLNVAIVELQVKSLYQGIYNVTGSAIDHVNSSLMGQYPVNGVQLETQSANSVLFDDVNGVGYYKALVGSYYGNFDPIFTFDPSTNTVVSVTNYYGQGTNSQGRAAVIDPSVPSTASGTPGVPGFKFTVGYIMTQGGSPRTYYNETYVLKATY